MPGPGLSLEKNSLHGEIVLAQGLAAFVVPEEESLGQPQGGVLALPLDGQHSHQQEEEDHDDHHRGDHVQHVRRLAIHGKACGGEGEVRLALLRVFCSPRV